MKAPGEALLIKLWETLAEKGIGALLSPWQIRREGKAHNEVRRSELLLLTQAEAEVSDIRAGRKILEPDGTLRTLPQPSDPIDTTCLPLIRVEPHLDQVALDAVTKRINYADSLRKEINLCRAIVVAEEILANDPQKPPDRCINEDWLFTWREYAGRVSEEELRALWGGILAGEIKSPGLFSIRTLEFLRGLSKDEADTISKIAPFFIGNFMPEELIEYARARGVTDGALIALEDLGLLRGATTQNTLLHMDSQRADRFFAVISTHKRIITIESQESKPYLRLFAYTLTKLGTQVLSIGQFEPDMGYLKEFAKYMRGSGFTVSFNN